MKFDPQETQRAQQVLDHCRARSWHLASAESCTGGLISALLTSVAGSSDVFTHGFITYANAAKIAMLGVDAVLIETHGAVSEEVARAMAEGALIAAHSEIAVAVTGIAGPGGGTDAKPVGLVHIACATHEKTMHTSAVFEGDRNAVRAQASMAALQLILAAMLH